MLSLDQPKNVKLLISLLVFLGSKPITLKSKGRGSGSFLCSSLSNHDAKGWKGKKKIENKEREQKPRVDCIREG